MSTETLPLTPALADYLRAVSVREHPALARLRHEMADHPRASMQIAPEQGQLMLLGKHVILGPRPEDLCSIFRCES
jgi:predicted O-methyltransferase YrrM